MTQEKDLKRTLDDVKNEYNQLCFKAGNLQYEITVKTKDLNLLNDSLRNLNFEFAKIQAENVKAQEEKSKNE